MFLAAWIVLGLMVGFLGSRMVDRRGNGVVLDLVLGIVGALGGGFLFTRFSTTPAHDLNIYGVLAAAAGAVLVLLVNHGIRRGFADRLS